MSDLDIIIFVIFGVAIILISLYTIITITQDINETIRKCNEIGTWAKTNWKGEPMDRIDKFIDGLEEIFADIRERHVDDSVCGLCEYDGAYMGQSGDWCNECPGFDRDDCFKLSDETRKEWTDEIIKALSTIQPEPSWIPVDERLPSKEERKEWIDNNLDGIGYLYPCLVTRYSSINPDRTKNNPYVAKHYFDGEDFLNAGEEVCSEYIIAWMPLPEAYNPNK